MIRAKLQVASPPFPEPCETAISAFAEDIHVMKDKIYGFAYCLSLGDFDQPLFELSPLIQPRIDDAIACIKMLVKSPDFKNTLFFPVRLSWRHFPRKYEQPIASFVPFLIMPEIPMTPGSPFLSPS
jgi:hypothetical protein